MSWRSAVAFWKARRLRHVQPDTNPNPTITSASGSTTVVITGTNFAAVAPRPDAGQGFVENVYFGTVLATSWTVDSATQITALGSWNGTDTIVVNTSGGCAIGGAAAATYRILTEASDPIDAETADNLRTE